MDPILVQTLVIGGTGLACGLVLAVAARYLAIREDPRIEALAAMLPGVNCGGCGYAGCSEYARAMAKDGVPPNLCKPAGHDTVAKLAAYLGVDAAAGERHVALVRCAGDNARARRLAHYNGVADCAAAELVAGAGKACRFGCLGFGTCARICPVHAIEVSEGLAVVHPDLCIGCGQCVGACPRKLILLVPESRFIHILCTNPDRGPDVKRVCDVGCIGCTLCAKAVGNQGIRMEGALAVVDYGVALADTDVIAKCPQHTIVRRGGARGAEAAA